MKEKETYTLSSRQQIDIMKNNFFPGSAKPLEKKSFGHPTDASIILYLCPEANAHLKQLESSKFHKLKIYSQYIKDKSV